MTTQTHAACITTAGQLDKEPDQAQGKEGASMQCRELQVRYVRGSGLAQTSKPVRMPRDLVELVTPLISDLLHEVFVTVYLNARHAPIGYTRIDGSLSSVSVRPAQIFGTAFLCAAKALVVAHNHPSGDPTPSPEDNSLTQRISQLAELHKIDFLDHVIVTESGSFYSYAEEAKL
jgi:DNA repair protein RadC